MDIVTMLGRLDQQIRYQSVRWTGKEAASHVSLLIHRRMPFSETKMSGFTKLRQAMRVRKR